jgi:hypothetical protein
MKKLNKGLVYLILGAALYGLTLLLKKLNNLQAMAVFIVVISLLINGYNMYMNKKRP